ncbi:hypothetical protein ACSCBZ_29705 [Streptomyces niveiscabiei]|jgi:hypothetical protein|uniref:Uncharacterized protein n=1 Tax=Streptomyces niveiscabiei TaxID=164115 RepID=A0ABW9HZX9_9ACTN|nr:MULTISPECIES: hypothetical protein [Streptomyces]MDX3386876.1 hypothetical protein [Streptomyces niveiscabiei]
MRRTTLQKPQKKQSPRSRETPDPTPATRPEIRKDIARTWWPET